MAAATQTEQKEERQKVTSERAEDQGLQIPHAHPILIRESVLGSSTHGEHIDFATGNLFRGGPRTLLKESGSAVSPPHRRAHRLAVSSHLPSGAVPAGSEENTPLLRLQTLSAILQASGDAPGSPTAGSTRPKDPVRAWEAAGAVPGAERGAVKDERMYKIC